jgi:cobalt/nickel transport system permease protein
MHIPDGLLSAPVLATTGAVGAAGFLVGLRKLEKTLRDRTTVLMGTMAAFVFAAQMVKFPIGPGVAGHLMGGVLAAVLLGPWAGMVAIGAVLIVQCLLFGDGGLTALGANFVNMGVIGSFGGYAIYAPIRRWVGDRSGILIGAMAAAWFTVILGAGAFSVELAASGRWGSLSGVLGWMTLVHAGIGVGEAVITGLVVRFLLLTRPDLVHDAESAALSAAGRWSQVAAAGLIVALAVAVVLGPLALTWDRPDGLEYVLTRLGLGEGGPAAIPVPIAEYQMPGLGRIEAATAVAGLIGTLAVFGVGVGLARAFARAKPAGIGVDVA